MPSPDDRIAIIALTSPLGLMHADSHFLAPLTFREWRQLVAGLERMGTDLASFREQSREICDDPGSIDHSLLVRARLLLDRCHRVERATRDLEARGIWIATSGEKGYPTQWIRRLGSTAPPLVYGVGYPGNTDQVAIGIVGSRNISEPLTEVANDLGAAAVLGNHSIVSGGARGADRIGMNGALEVGGTVVGILPDHLQRERLRRPNRDEIEAGRLTMISVVHPDTPFRVGNAMYRNRLIYAQSELTIVVSATEGTGGTWAGAIGSLKSRWAPVVVWTGKFAPQANHRLVERGAMPMIAVPESNAAICALVHAAAVAFETNTLRPSRDTNLQLPLLEE